MFNMFHPVIFILYNSTSSNQLLITKYFIDAPIPKCAFNFLAYWTVFQNGNVHPPYHSHISMCASHVRPVTRIFARVEKGKVQEFPRFVFLLRFSTKICDVIIVFSDWWCPLSYVSPQLPTASQCTADHRNGGNYTEWFPCVWMCGGKECACGPQYLYSDDQGVLVVPDIATVHNYVLFMKAFLVYIKKGNWVL